MKCEYLVYVPGSGYLVDSLMAEPWYVFDEDIFQAALFPDFKSAEIVQKFLCWSFFKGERVVSIAPFPVNLKVESNEWQSS